MSDDHLYDLVIQWDQRRQLGEEVSPEDLCADQPELLDELKSCISDVQMTDWAFEPDDDEDDDDFLSLPDFDTIMKNADETQLPAVTLSIEEFTTAIADSGLMTGKEVEEIQQRSAAKDAQELARLLIREKKLTTYQATQICEGNTKGMVLGNYVILGKIGAGGMGQVFKARHRRMKRVVALKVLPEHAVNSPTAVERFHREVEAAAKLEHPNIVIAHDADESDGTHFLVMQYVDGQDLATLVQRQGRLSVSKAVNCILQAAKGLEFAHGEGVIHRDIKPANLLIDKKGCVKVLDMGLALLETSNGEGDFAATQAHLTQDGSVMGTVDYMSPEQALQTHHADARSDIYSLGCTLYYLLTGKPIYGGGTLMAKMLAHREEEIPMLSAERDDIPEKLTDIFRKMVAKNSDERYPTMTALLEEIDALVSEFGDSWQDDESDASSSVAIELEVDAGAKETSSAELDDTVDIAPKLTPHDTPLKQPAANRSRLFAGGVVGLLMVGLIGYWLFGIIFEVETPDGIIQIETNVTDVEIFVDNEKVVYITDPKDKRNIRVEIPKGAETLQVSKEGFEADVKEFRLKTVKGPVKVSFVAVEKPVVGSDAHRQTAEWVLGIGGEIVVSLEEGQVSVSAVENLPDESFTLFSIRVPADSDSTDDQLAELRRLCEGVKIRNLYLDKTAITDDGLANLTGLSIIQLSLTDTQITNAGIEHVKKVRNLSALVLQGTNVSDEGVREIATIGSLTGIGLADTPITDTALEHLKQLPNLTSLNINITNISDNGLKHVAVHRSLHTLLASQCDGITDVGLKHLGELTNLEVLELIYIDNFTDAGIADLGKLKKLSRLTLSSPKISDVGLQAICEQFPNLSILALGHAGVTDAGLEHLTKLSNLNTLHLGDTSIDGKGLIHLKSLAHMEVLLLNSSSELSGDALIAISNLQNLRELFLQKTPISDADIENLARLKKLAHLDLRQSKVTAKGVAQLQKALPNCKIDYVADPQQASR